MSDAPEPWRIRNDARWAARRRWRSVGILIAAALPPVIGSQVGSGPSWVAALGPVLIGSAVGGLLAAWRPTAVVGLPVAAAVWVVAGAGLLRVPVLGSGVEALIESHLAGVAAIAISVIGASWLAMDPES